MVTKFNGPGSETPTGGKTIPKTPATGGSPKPEDLPTIYDGMSVDPELIQKYGAQLQEPANRMGEILSRIAAQAERLTKYGKKPWGDGEIGAVYEKSWNEDILPFLASVDDMKEGILNVSGKYGVSGKKYVNAEEANMPWDNLPSKSKK